MNRVTKMTLGFLAILSLTGTTLAHQPVSQDSQKTKIETGYVISLRGNSLSMSNVPLGGGGSGGSSGGPQRRIMMRTADGKTRELRGKEAEQAMKSFRQEGGGTSVQVTEENGQKRYTVRGPDGKTRELTPEEFEKLRKKMQAGGGHAVVRSTEGEQTSSGGNAAAGREKKQVKFHRFVLNDQTRKPDQIERGTKVKVHYRLEGGKKIATKIEVVSK